MLLPCDIINIRIFFDLSLFINPRSFVRTKHFIDMAMFKMQSSPIPFDSIISKFLLYSSAALAYQKVLLRPTSSSMTHFGTMILKVIGILSNAVLISILFFMEYIKELVSSNNFWFILRLQLWQYFSLFF